MHRTEPCNRNYGALRPSTSRSNSFPSIRINAFGHAASNFRSGPTARSDLSLAYNECSLSEPPLQGQRSRPTTSLSYHPVTTARSDFHSTTAHRSYRLTAASPRKSRCSAAVRSARSLLQSPLLLGTITSLRIKAFDWFGYRSVRLPNPPDLPSLPAAHIYY